MNANVPKRLSRTEFDDEVWLLGQPPLHKLLSYIEDTAIGGDSIRPAQIVDQWRIANDIFYELEKTEAGIASSIGIRALPARMKPLADALARDPYYRRGFDIVPTRVAMVELDKLVVSQQHVNVSHAMNARARLGPKPSPRDLFNFALPVERSLPPLEFRETGPKKYVIWSPSSDIRFHEAKMFGPDMFADYSSFGPIGAVLGLVVGFGSNFLNAIESDNRLVLHNGHHRAYAMRHLGVKYAPCLIQTVTRTDELNVVASGQVCENPAFYFKAPRPPLLKDFFDPMLSMMLRIPKLVRMIEINFDIRDFEAKSFQTGS